MNEISISKKEPTLKDYLMERHWIINKILKKGIYNKKTKISSNTKDQRLTSSSLDGIRPSILLNTNTNQTQKYLDTQTSQIGLKHAHLKQTQQIYKNRQRNQTSSIIDNESFLTLTKKNTSKQMNNKRSFETSQLQRHKTALIKDSAINKLKQLSKVDTLYGVHFDEQKNKKTYFKIKVSVIQMEEPFLGITLEDCTEKNEYMEIKRNQLLQQKTLSQSLKQMKIQALETIDMCKPKSLLLSVPLLRQINLIDCLQDDLLRNNDQKKVVKPNKTNFSIKSLLQDIEKIFQVSLIFGGNQNLQQSISNNILTQRLSVCQYQGKPQKDSQFSKQRYNSEMIIDSLDNHIILQTRNQNLEGQNLKISKEIPCSQTITIQNIKINENQLNGNSTQIQTDQFLINNDFYRLKQILIALTTNMICWNKDLKEKNLPISERKTSDTNSQIESSQIELLCTEESNQLFDYYNIKFRLNSPNLPFMPNNDFLLQYLSGSNNSEINKLFKKLINTNISVVGPHKLKAEVTDDGLIEISFDVFKNIDVMENREKGSSLNSQSYMASHNNISATPPLGATTPPFGATSPPFGATSPPLVALTPLQEGSKAFNNTNNTLTTNFTPQAYSKKLSQQYQNVNSINKNNKQLNFQSQHNNNYNISINISHQQNNQIDNLPNLNEFPSFTSRQYGESEKYVTYNYEQIQNSNMILQCESSSRQIQNQQNNTNININNIRGSQQVLSNYPVDDSDSEKSSDITTNENFKKGNITKINLINETVKDLQIHTISQINKQ